MQSKRNENTVISYKNPFDDYNANVLAPDLIMQYWCTPFSTGALKEFDELKFFSEKMPIVLQGSRGSGKTTILKYFSFPVQCERAAQSGICIGEQLRKDSGVGFYLRCDDSFLNMFKTVFYASVKDTWQLCFKHYLELFFSKNIISMLRKIEYADNITESEFIDKLQLPQFDEFLSFSTLEELECYLDSEIKYLNKYKNEALFTKAAFSPKHIWDFYELSGTLIEAIQKNISDLSNVNFLLLVDEFENLPVDLQKMFNTMIKFCKSGMSMRIGRRSENIVTTATVNSVEYLREGNDYRLIVLDYQGQDIQELKPYLLGIAEKRLEAFEGIEISNNLAKILGEKEDLDAECDRIIANRTTHLDILLRENPKIADEKLRQQIIQIISYPKNRIAETLCALWVSRSEDSEDLLTSARVAAEAMRAQFEKGEHPLKEKFANDYNNKYRYALTVFICSAYKKDKAYYSFNTLCYLSEGNARTFINLCKAIISDAFFYEKKYFTTTGQVSVDSQSRAIRDYSISEFNSVCSIIQNGKSIKNLILGIGNVFSEYHKDKLIRYPETTQFTFSPEDLTATCKDVVDIAESWALIKRRREMQRLSAGVGQEGYLYAINRVFSPIFNISYRVRGGVNVVFSAEDIDQMIAGHKISKLTATKKKRSSSTKKLSSLDMDQMSVFDGGNT